MSTSKAPYMTIPLHVVSFVDMFCRRNLSRHEIALISEIFSLVEQSNWEGLHELLDQGPSIVTASPRQGRSMRGALNDADLRVSIPKGKHT